MKLPATAQTASRCVAALLRNALSYRRTPLACPVRKCRRDGFCSGPLVVPGKSGNRLVAADASDCSEGQMAVPLCFLLHETSDQEDLVRIALSDFRCCASSADGWVMETSRTLSSRRFRRLAGGREAVPSAPAAVKKHAERVAP